MILNVNILDRKKPKFGLKIIPFNPAGGSIFTDAPSRTSGSEDSQTFQVTELSWHPQPFGQIRKRPYHRKQEFLQLERGFNLYVPTKTTTTPPLTPQSLPPPPSPPLPPPPPPPPSPPPPSQPSPPTSPPPSLPPLQCPSPPVPSKASSAGLAPAPSSSRGLLPLPPGQSTNSTARWIVAEHLQLEWEQQSEKLWDQFVQWPPH